MGRNPDALDAVSMPLYDVFNGTVGQLSAMVGKEIEILCGLQSEVVGFGRIIPHQRLFENWSNGNHPLLMVFATGNHNVVIVNIFRFDAAKFPTADPGFKEGGEDGTIPDGKKIIAATGDHHLPDVGGLEGCDDGLFFLAPFEVLFRIEAAVSFFVTVLDE